MQLQPAPTSRSVVVTVAVDPESVEFLGMGKSNPDELLVVLRPISAAVGKHEKRILVVDAQQTFSSGNLSVVCSATRSLPAGRILEGFILITKTGAQCSNSSSIRCGYETQWHSEGALWGVLGKLRTVTFE
ncbi:hypothetical protein Pelo_3732 [Pelomyxa schiedti]|nr:hypothetical protein Pelo_3732 [Pelomyxa schiedti]